METRRVMRDLGEWSANTDSSYESRCVLAFDLDDTLTTEGSLSSDVLKGLERLQAAGHLVFLVTGRGAGWVDALIRLLPFDGIVGENGALLYFWKNGKVKRARYESVQKLYFFNGKYQDRVPDNLKALHSQAEKLILSQIPRARVASDQAFRFYDLAIDFAEDVNPPLSLEAAEKIKSLFESIGAQAKVSSIHVNGWWGSFSKARGLEFLMTDIFQKKMKEDLIYVGDSPNDASLFEVSGMSVGVRNIENFAAFDFYRPQWRTSQYSGKGALELISRVLDRHK